MHRARFALLLGLGAVVALTAGLSAASPVRARAKRRTRSTCCRRTSATRTSTRATRARKKAAKELGDTVTYNAPTEATGTKQVPFIDTAVRQGYKAIIISPPTRTRSRRRSSAAQPRGVKVVTYDADTVPSARTVFVSLPDFKSGRRGADRVARLPDRL